MVDHDAAIGLLVALPEVEEGTTYGNRAWKLRGKLFAWDRPFSKADVRRFGDDPVPDGPIMGVRVDDLADKESVLAAGTPGVFTIPHFDGHPAVLVQLDVIETTALAELFTDGWLAVAPAELAADFIDGD